MSENPIWTYNDVYGTFVRALNRYIDLQRYVVYFAVVALSTNNPSALVRMTVKDTYNNTQKQEEGVVTGDTVQKLGDSIVNLIDQIIEQCN